MPPRPKSAILACDADLRGNCRSFWRMAVRPTKQSFRGYGTRTVGCVRISSIDYDKEPPTPRSSRLSTRNITFTCQHFHAHAAPSSVIRHGADSPDPPPKLPTHGHESRVFCVGKLRHAHMVAVDPYRNVSGKNSRVLRHNLYQGVSWPRIVVHAAKLTWPTPGRGSCSKKQVISIGSSPSLLRDLTMVWKPS